MSIDRNHRPLRLSIARRVARLLASMSDLLDRLENAPVIPMESLRPVFNQEAHGIYVDILSHELHELDPPRNVAVSGPYGSGKSSVLLELRHRQSQLGIVEVALATIDENTTAITGQAELHQVGVVTDALQKEIVKRLLYSVNPARLPRSQLNRIRPFATRQAITVSIVGSLAASLISAIYVLPTPFVRWFLTWPAGKIPLSHGLWLVLPHVLDASIAFAALMCAQWLLSRIRFRKVEVGSFSLEREDPNQNYFDQYLDEIVYFFTATRTRVVVFEDLDRFKNQGIFIALRELNVLLNNSKSIRQSVTFIYALGDRVFIPSLRPAEPQGVASAGTNRAKFFDLIVPIVPFISTETASGHMSGQLAHLNVEERPSEDLVRLVATHFPDMRVINSIRNEYEIYYDRLIRRGSLQLDKDHLFAMVVYKQAFPEDYEEIQFSNSKLDRVISEVDKAVVTRLAGLDHDVIDKQNAVSQQASENRLAAQAGGRLRNVLQIAADPSGAVVINEVIVGKKTFPEAELDSPSFWRAIEDAPATDLQIRLSSTGVLRVPRSALDPILPADLPAETWLASAAAEDPARVKRLKDIRRDLVHANLTERLNDRRYTGVGIARNLDGELEQTEIDLAYSARTAVESAFVFTLLQQGYIDETFALYASAYQDALLSVNAQNFRIQHIARRRSAPLYDLSPEDVSELREKVGDRFLDEPSVLNVSIFDTLLATDALNGAVSEMASGELDPSHDFVTNYLLHGAEPTLLIQRLAPITTWLFKFLADSTIADDQKRAAFGAALSSASSNIAYEDSRSSDLMLADVAQSSLRGFGEFLEADAARAIARMLSSHGLRVPELSLLSADGRLAMANVGAFEMNRSNLASLTGARTKLGLDSLARDRPVLLPQILNRLPEYVEVLKKAKARSIDNDEHLVELVSAVAQFGPREVEEVIAMAPAAFQIHDIATFDFTDERIRAALPVLAKTHFFAPTASNVLRYLEIVEGIDEGLFGLLTKASRLTGANALRDEDRESLADSLAESVRLSVKVMNGLLKSLGVKAIDPRGLRISRPEVMKLLIREKYLADDEVTFAAFSKLPWPVREAAFEASTNAHEFIGQLALSAEDLARVLTSAKIADGVKLAIIGDPSQFPYLTTAAGADAAVVLASSAGTPFTSVQLMALLEAGADDDHIIMYLGMVGEHITDVEVVQVISRLGGDWPTLVNRLKKWKLFPNLTGLKALAMRLQKMGYVKNITPGGAEKTRITFAV